MTTTHARAERTAAAAPAPVGLIDAAVEQLRTAVAEETHTELSRELRQAQRHANAAQYHLDDARATNQRIARELDRSRTTVDQLRRRLDTRVSRELGLTLADATTEQLLAELGKRVQR